MQGQNGEVLYEIVHGDQQNQFSIDQRSGLISVGRSLDREMIASYGKSEAVMDAEFQLSQWQV